MAMVLTVSASSALAWNDFGHMVVAAVAYQSLARTPTVRSKVDALLKLHPDHGQWIEGVPAQQQGEVAFLMASRWADAIRRDSAYVNDGEDNGETPVEPAASLNIGYEDKARHKYWHYKDLGFSTDGTPVDPPKVPNAATAIKQFRATLASPRASAALKSYDLAWLLHLVGDVHQPLHATSRFTADMPHGDVGGNRVALCAWPCRDELHAFWDSVLGRDETPAAAMAFAATLEPAPAEEARILDVDTWLSESQAIAKTHVYMPPIGARGTGRYALDESYKAHALEVARRRVALAGARLGRLLREALQAAAQHRHVRAKSARQR